MPDTKYYKRMSRDYARHAERLRGFRQFALAAEYDKLAESYAQAAEAAAMPMKDWSQHA